MKYLLIIVCIDRFETMQDYTGYRKQSEAQRKENALPMPRNPRYFIDHFRNDNLKWHMNNTVPGCFSRISPCLVRNPDPVDLHMKYLQNKAEKETERAARYKQENLIIRNFHKAEDMMHIAHGSAAQQAEQRADWQAEKADREMMQNSNRKGKGKGVQWRAQDDVRRIRNQV